VPLVMGPDHAKLSKRHGATSVAEFRANGYLPEALANYLALLGWSPGDGEELLPLDELARRFRVEDVGRSAGVFDPEKLAWANRHYLKQATPSRLALLVTPYLQEAGWLSEAGPDARAFLEATVPALAGEVDRIADMLGRIRFLFDYAPQRALDDPALRAEATAAHSVLEALASELDESPPLIDRETFRAAAARVTARTGAKGRALFHPIRLALTGESSGLELDSAVPAIDRGAALPADSGLAPITSAQQRARAFVEALAGGGC
jgi:nondiscriminating glutamyl-tRNA synthetase